MVRYCRSGGEAVSIAIRIARASNDKELILFMDTTDGQIGI